MSLDMWFTFEIGDCTGNFQYSCVGPGAQAEFIHCHFNQAVRAFIEQAEGVDLCIGHVGIASCLQIVQSTLLYVFSVIDSLFYYL